MNRFFKAIPIFLISCVAGLLTASEEPTLSFIPHESSSGFVRESSFSGLTQRLNLEESLAQGINRKKGLFQAFNVGAAWVPTGGGVKGMGYTECKFGLSIALPAPKVSVLTNSFFIPSPGFTYTSMDGDWTNSFPKSLYNAGLSVTWMKPLNEQWSIMLNVTPGYAGDGKATRQTVRCPVMFGATWTPNKQWKVLMGIIYTDRPDLPVLPFGGFTYTPNDDWRFEFMLPQPRVARRITSWCSDRAERWVYFGAGFGGGSWAVESTNGWSDFAQYREYSVLVGYEFVSKVCLLKWNAEAALLFGREMKFEHETQSKQRFDSALSLRLKGSF